MNDKEYKMCEDLVDVAMSEEDARFVQNLIRENREPLEQEDHDKLIEIYDQFFDYGMEK